MADAGWYVKIFETTFMEYQEDHSYSVDALRYLPIPKLVKETRRLTSRNLYRACDTLSKTNVERLETKVTGLRPFQSLR